MKERVRHILTDLGECQLACVKVLVPRPPMGTRPSNKIANWFMALLHSRIGILHFVLMFRKPKYSSLKTASSLGNSARFLLILRKVILRDSMVLVV